MIVCKAFPRIGSEKQFLNLFLSLNFNFLILLADVNWSVLLLIISAN